jgi:GNAT superfamily N-acetyltransferase
MSETSDPGKRLRIRPLLPDDRDFVLDLAERLAEVGMPPWRDPEAMRAFHHRYAVATVEAGGRGEADAVFVAEGADGERLGAVHVHDDSTSLTGEPQAYLATLAVAAEAEGRGVGRALMEAAEVWAHARGHRVLALDVFAGNVGARAFYERLGYRDETVTMVKVLR